jgi:hypothetical protein
VSNQWTDEKIQAEIDTVASRGYVRQLTAEALMGRMRDELTADDHRLTQHCNDLNNEVQELRQKLATERADTMTMKAAWIDTAGDYGTLLEKHETLLAWAKQAYKFMETHVHEGAPSRLLADAPEEV